MKHAFFALLLTMALVPRAMAGEVWGRKYDVVDLAPGVHSVIWQEVIAGPVAIGNSTFIIGDDDVIVVDATTLVSTAQAVIDEIKARTSKPVRYVIVTHWHEDHIQGLQRFREVWPGVEGIGHPNTPIDYVEKNIPILKDSLEGGRKYVEQLEGKKERTEREERALAYMRKLTAEFASIRFEVPTLLAESMSIVRGKRTIEIRHHGLANTRGDLVVFLPNEKIALTGDVAILPQQWALESYVGPWIETLARIAAIPATTWVPGHGPVQRDNRYLFTVRDVLRTIHGRVAAGIKEGKSLEELKSSIDVPEYRKAAQGESGIGKEWYDQYFLTPAIEQSYKELKK